MPNVKIKLAAVRVNSGMTIEKWANALGVNKETVSNWENGRSEPKLTQVRRMSELSGIPIDFIFCDLQSDDIVGSNNVVG